MRNVRGMNTENKFILRTRAVLDRAKSELDKDGHSVRPVEAPTDNLRGEERAVETGLENVTIKQERSYNRTIVTLIPAGCIIVAMVLIAVHYRAKSLDMKLELAKMSAISREVEERQNMEIAALREEITSIERSVAERKEKAVPAPPEKPKRKKFLGIF